MEGLDERSAHVCLYIYISLAIESQYSRTKERENAEQRHHKKVALSLFLPLAEVPREVLLLSLRRGVSLERFSLSLEESVVFPYNECASEEYEAERDDDALFFVFSFSVLFGSDEDAERAEKTERGERFFVVECDCE